MKKIFVIAFLLVAISLAQEVNTIKLVEDYPVTDKRCQTEPQDERERIVNRSLKEGRYSFPKEGVVRYDYISKGNWYQYDNVVFEKKIIQFMFKDSEMCEKFMDEFDNKKNLTAYNECKDKEYKEYQSIRDNYIKNELEKAGITKKEGNQSYSEVQQIIKTSLKADQSLVVKTAYYTYLRKMQECEGLIQYPY